MPREPDSNGAGASLDEVLAAYLRRVDAGEAVDPKSLLAAHPEHAAELRAYFSHAALVADAAEEPTANFAHLATPLTDLTCSSCGSHFSLVDQTKATRMAPALTKMGRFDLIERLGVGGFGSVWKARDKELDRTVAIKIPRAGGMSGEEQEKFFREARAAAQLRHPNIVSVHEVGRDGDTLKCLEKAPERRYPTAKELADELGRYLAGDAIWARPIGRAARGAGLNVDRPGPDFKMVPHAWANRNSAVAAIRPRRRRLRPSQGFSAEPETRLCGWRHSRVRRHGGGVGVDLRRPGRVHDAAGFRARVGSRPQAG
jgi:hypothetical protein